nr:hypothetical protein [Saprospiraceae bacterium]
MSGSKANPPAGRPARPLTRLIPPLFYRSSGANPPTIVVHSIEDPMDLHPLGLFVHPFRVVCSPFGYVRSWTVSSV